MAREIVITSAARGVKLGRSGFQVVMRTAGMREDLTESLEALAVYRHLPPGAGQNPECLFYRVVKAGGGQFHVLGRVGDAGSDYSNRSNKLAHLVALDQQELGPLRQSSPAVVLQAIDGRLARTWPGGPEERQQSFAVGSAPAVNPGPCVRWRDATGDAGWAGLLADRAAKGQPTLIIAPDSSPASCRTLLALFAEALAFVPVAKRWDVSFDTTVISSAPVLWRGTYAGSPESMNRLPGLVVIDLARRPQLPAESAGLPLVAAARAGRLAEPVAPPIPTGGGGPRPPAGGGPKPDDMCEGLEDDQRRPPPPGGVPTGSGPGGSRPPAKKPKSKTGLFVAIGGIVAAVLLLVAVVGGFVAWSLYHRHQVDQAQQRIQAWADVADGTLPKGPEPSLADWTLVYQIPVEPPKVEKNAAAPPEAVPHQARFEKVVNLVNLALLSAPLKELPSRDSGAGSLMRLVESAERLQAGVASLEDLATIGFPGKDLIGDGQPVPPSLQEFLVKQRLQQGAAVIDRIRQGKATLNDYGLFVGVGQLDDTAKKRLNEYYQEVGKQKRRLSSIEDCTASLLRARDKTATVGDLERLGVPFAGFQAAGDTPAAGFQQHFWEQGAAAAREVLAKVREGKAAKDDWVMLKVDDVTDAEVARWNASIAKQSGEKKESTLTEITGGPSGGPPPKETPQAQVLRGESPPGAEEKAWEQFAAKAVARATWGGEVTLARGIDGKLLDIEGVNVKTDSGSELQIIPENLEPGKPYRGWHLQLSNPDQKQAGTVTLKDDSLVFERAADGPDISSFPLVFRRRSDQAGEHPAVFKFAESGRQIAWEGADTLRSLLDGKDVSIVVPANSGATKWNCELTKKSEQQLTFAVEPDVETEKLVISYTAKLPGHDHTQRRTTLIEEFPFTFDSDKGLLTVKAHKSWSERPTRGKDLKDDFDGDELTKLGWQEKKEQEGIPGSYEDPGLPRIVGVLLKDDDPKTWGKKNQSEFRRLVGDFRLGKPTQEEKKPSDKSKTAITFDIKAPLLGGVKDALVDFCVGDADVASFFGPEFDKQSPPQPEPPPDKLPEDADDAEKKAFEAEAAVKKDEWKRQEDYRQKLRDDYVREACRKPLEVHRLLREGKFKPDPSLKAGLILLRDLEGMVLAKVDGERVLAAFEDVRLADLFTATGQSERKVTLNPGGEHPLPVEVRVGPPPK